MVLKAKTWRHLNVFLFLLLTLHLSAKIALPCFTIITAKGRTSLTQSYLGPWLSNLSTETKRYQMTLQPQHWQTREFPKAKLQLPFLVAHSSEIPNYVKTATSTFSIGVLNVTVGTYFPKQQVHLFVRIGELVYHWSDGKLLIEPMDEIVRTLTRLEFIHEIFELTFHLPYDLIMEAKRYFRDRVEQKATLNGRTIKSRFAKFGTGSLSNGQIRDNCLSFATSFAHSQWHADYPRLRELALAIGMEPIEKMTIPHLRRLLWDLTPSLVMAWNSSPQLPIAPSHGPHWRLLDAVGVTNYFSLTDDDIVITQ